MKVKCYEVYSHSLRGSKVGKVTVLSRVQLQDVAGTAFDKFTPF